MQQLGKIPELTASVEEESAEMGQVVQTGEIVIEHVRVGVTAHEIQDDEHIGRRQSYGVMDLPLYDGGEFPLHEYILFERRP